VLSLSASCEIEFDGAVGLTLLLAGVLRLARQDQV
jgi:hypothetical protein